MNELLVHLFELERDLRQMDLRWALIGGLAVSLRAEPRTTRDLDLAVAVEGDKEAERIVRDFLARGYRIYEDPLEQIDVDRLAIVRFLAPGQDQYGVIVDLLFASSGIEQEIVAMAEEMEIVSGTIVPVVTMGHLLALKTLAGRPKDQEDLRLLLRHAVQQDIHLAHDSLDLISRRGYDGGKNLQDEFSKFLN